MTTTTYTSLGGVATVENSDAVVVTRAAIALHPLHRDQLSMTNNTGLNNSTVLAPTVVVTRKTREGGGDTTITLTLTQDADGALGDRGQI